MKLETSVCYDDVLLKPSFSDIESRKEVDISPFRLSNIGLSCSIPIISSPMDTITEHEMARTLSCAGGIGVIHRYNSIEEQAEEVAAALESQAATSKAPAVEESKAEGESKNNESSDSAQQNDAPASESASEQPAKESKSTAWLGILGAAALVVATAIWMAVKS